MKERRIKMDEIICPNCEEDISYYIKKAKTQTINEIIELIEIKGYMERWQKGILIKEIKGLGK